MTRVNVQCSRRKKVQQTIYPLECKKSASPGMGDIRSFGVLANLKMPVGPGAVICLAQQSLPLGPAVRSVPVACL